MVWIYFLALEDFQLPSKNGLNQLHTAKVIPTVKESCSVVYPTDHSLMRQFGMISRRCRMMGEIGPESTSSTEDFHVRTSVLQEMEKAWKEKEVALFMKYSDWPENLVPPSFSWKMSQQSQPEVVWYWQKKLPKWGMIVDGVLYPLQALEHHTNEKGGSYWPTPDASPRGARKNQNGHHYTLQDAVGSGKLNPTWVEWLMGYSHEWSALEPLAMQWYLSKRKKRLKS